MKLFRLEPSQHLSDQAVQRRFVTELVVALVVLVTFVLAMLAEYVLF